MELKILMLEDVEEDSLLIQRVLQKAGIRFESLRVDSKEDFIRSIDSFQPDIVLSDHALPQFNSSEALRIFKEKSSMTPFILVTGAVSEEFAVSSLHLGADDYILKSNLARLPSAINNAINKKKAERERAIANHSLMLQNQELKKLNQELDRFVYSTSHNLRAPLLSVLGLVRLSRQEIENKTTEELPQYFEMIEKSITQLDTTLRQIIDYSKNARLEEEPDEINFEDLLQGTFDYMKFINGATNISQNIVIHEGPSFYCGKMRMNFVLQNLISNSIKYYDATKDNPFVKVEVFKNESEARIVIEDNGIGISKKYQENIFDMFFRATERSDGSGLGLYIVKETIDMMGGRIELNSEKNKGTSVTLTIPNFRRTG
ncbi:MAG: hybrid sensor histidine kinase/response regulator [Cyclobacteriaceae bacterium]|nr:hybrid sensor histidine kinase/response regulator [Cyclobacteriaceae bacterium]